MRPSPIAGGGVRKAASPGQLDLVFFEIPPEPGVGSGGQDVASALRELLSDVLAAAKARGRDRHAIAAEISRLSGRDITKNMLDRYCASAEEWRFPLETLPAFAQATGDLRLLEFIAQACGCRVMRGEEALLAEIGALMLEERAAKNRLERIRRALQEKVSLDRLMEKAAERLHTK